MRSGLFTVALGHLFSLRGVRGAPPANVLAGLACDGCEFLTDGETGLPEDLDAQTGLFVLSLPSSERIASVAVWCLPMDKESFLKLTVVDVAGLETSMTVASDRLGPGLTRVPVEVSRSVRSIRVETNTVLTEVEAYRPDGLRGPKPATSGEGVPTHLIVLVAAACLLCAVWALPSVLKRRSHVRPEPVYERQEEEEKAPTLAPAPRGPRFLSRLHVPVRIPAVSRCLPTPRCLPKSAPAAQGPPTLKYMFATPLVRVAAGMILPYPPLGVEAELRRLRLLARGAARPVGLEAAVASAESLRQALLDPRELCVHLTTHGDEGGLVLEDCVGRAHQLDAAKVTQLLGAQSCRVRVLVLGSTQSFHFGNLFLRAGVRNVICSEEGGSAERARFVEGFWRSLFAGRSVQEAFGIAKGPEAGFLLLSSGACPAPFYPRFASSDEESDAVLGGPSSSDEEAIDEPTPRERVRLPRRKARKRPLEEEFVGRQVDVWAIVSHLARRRLVVVCGTPGSQSGNGKSVAVEQVARWAATRGGFGKVHLVHGGEHVWASVAEAVRARRPRLEQVGEELRAGPALLVLDGVDELMQSPSGCAELQRLLELAPKLRVLVTSHEPCTWSGRYKAVHYALRPLAPVDAAELFLRHCGRPLTRADVGGDGPLDRPGTVQALASHPLVAKLGGYPTAILAAAAMVRPNLTLYDLLGDEPRVTPASPPPLLDLSQDNSITRGLTTV